MRNTITLNGIASTTIAGLLIQELPAISKPLMRTEIEEIDGRDGDIVTDLGYSAYDKEITVGLYGTYDINTVIKYFTSEGTVIFSNESDKVYKYKIIQQIDFERLVRYRTATVTFHCQPFKYPATETPVQLGNGQTVSGEGTDITLANTALAPFVSITPKGDTSQQTYTGKNLFNINTTPTWIGADTTYSVSGNTLHVEGKWFVGILTPVEANTNYYVSALRKNVASVNRAGHISVYGGYNTDVVAEFQTNNGTFNSGNRTSVYLVFYSDSGSDNGSADFENIQLEKGTTGTDYEPYVGGTAAPNPDYPQDVKVVTGEQMVEVHTDNLLNINFTNTTRNGLTYTNNGDGTITISGTTNGTSDGFNISPYSSSKPLVLKKNTYYTQRVEVVSGSQGPIAVVPSFKNSSGTIVWNYFSNNGGRLTEDVMKNNNYNVYWQGTGQQVNVTLRIWLVEGYNLEAPFVPYQSQKYEVNLGKNLFNTIDRTQNRMSMDCGTTNNRVTVNGTPTRNNFGGSYWNLNGTDNASANYYNYDNTTSGTTLPAGTYTLSIHNISGSYTSPSSVQLFATKVYSGSTPIPTLATITLTNNQTSATFTLAEETTVKIQFRVAVSSDTGVAVPVFNNYSFDLQLEQGSKVTTYAPFMSKNLLDPAKMVDGYVGSDGTIVQVSNTGDMATPYFIPVAPNSTLTFTIYKTTGTNAPWFGMCEYSSANESSFITRQVEQTAGITSATFTVGSTTKYVRVSARNMNVATEYQLEIGNTSTAYEPYSIELCKIGDYQDYFYKGSDGWYFHKIFGKLVVWPKQISNYNNHSGSNYITINYNYRLVQKLSTIEVTTASNRFVGATITQTWQGSVINGVSQPTNGTYLQFSLSASAGSSLAEVQSYFESRETEAYFLLENPIDIKIVNTNLISQLEALASANSYSGTTHIDTASDGYNQPVIIAATATGNMDGTVTNSGNMYSRPKLTIYGTGTIGIYLNGNQMFSVDMGDNDHITIDTDAMNAYKDTTDNLKNRLVTGDYSQFKLMPGANSITFTGNSTKCIVENYTRWI